MITESDVVARLELNSLKVAFSKLHAVAAKKVSSCLEKSLLVFARTSLNDKSTIIHFFKYSMTT